MAEVTITRTLFRSGDSEYAINGTACRLLDIQELLSDSGVGRQQHMIIGQGQLDTVLNARPEDRRAIIEEAAGVLKHRRRRERAERRLAATQENLERLGDLVREVRRQIRPLERQAAAARSYTALAAELRAVRLHLAGTELAELAGPPDGRRRRAGGPGHRGARAAADAGRPWTRRPRPPRPSSRRSREEDLASALGRVQGLVERTRGTAGVLRERARGLAAALDAAADVDVVSTLEAEGARLIEAELAEAEEASAGLEPERLALDAAAEALAADQLAHRQTWGDGSGVQAAEQALAPGPRPSGAAGAGPGAGPAGAGRAGRPDRRPRAAGRGIVRHRRAAGLPGRGVGGGGRAWGPRPGRPRRPTSRRASGPTTPSGRPTRPSSSATARPPGPRRWTAPCTSWRGPAAGRCWPGWTGWSAPWSTWSRSTPGGRRPSRRRPGRPSPRWWWTAGRRPAQALARLHTEGATGALLAARDGGRRAGPS